MLTLDHDQLIGAADLARIVGHPQRTIGEWRGRQNILPNTEVKVDDRGTLIWRASTVLAAVAAAGRYDGPIPEPMPLPDLVSIGYVMDATGKTRRRVQWMLDPRAGTRLPDPEHRVSGTPLWSRATIDRWLDEQKAAV